MSYLYIAFIFMLLFFSLKYWLFFTFRPLSPANVDAFAGDVSLVPRLVVTFTFWWLFPHHDYYLVFFVRHCSNAFFPLKRSFAFFPPPPSLDPQQAGSRRPLVCTPGTEKKMWSKPKAQEILYDGIKGNTRMPRPGTFPSTVVKFFPKEKSDAPPEDSVSPHLRI